MKFPLSTTFIATLFLGLSLALTGCQQTSPNVYSSSNFGSARETIQGTIESSRPVTVENEGHLGMLAGAALGGLGGAQLGGGTSEHILGGIGGGLLGGVAGREVEKATTRQPAVEYVVRTGQGKLYTIVQGSSPRLAIGEQVYMQLYANDRARVTPIGDSMLR